MQIFCVLYTQNLRECDSSPPYMNNINTSFRAQSVIAYVYCMISTSVEQCLLPESWSSGFSPIVAKLKFHYLLRSKEAGGNTETNIFVREG